jgi:exosortase/archaeosortase family protein
VTKLLKQLSRADASRSRAHAATSAAAPDAGDHLRAAPVTRGLLFGGLTVVGFANGISERAAEQITGSGVVSALFNTLGVSAVVWAAAILALWLLAQAPREAPTRMDLAAAAAAAIAFLLPIPSLAWLAIAGVAAWLAWTSPPYGPLRRAAVVLAAMTVPMLWARILFALFSNTILGVDAKLVGWLVGTQSAANTVPLVNGNGVLFLEPACSSLTNVSLALLCGALFVKAYDRPWSRSIIGAILLACFVTIGINVFRISLIGVFPDYYALIHGTTGAMAAEWVTLLAVLAIYTAGIKPNAPAHA